MDIIAGQLRPYTARQTTSSLASRSSIASSRRCRVPSCATRKFVQSATGLPDVVCGASKSRTSHGTTAKEIQRKEESELQLFSTAALPIVITALAEAESTGYSQASYYASLGLFVISFPGLYSLIKRSTKSKVVRRTFEVAGPAVPGSKPLAKIAGEISAFLTRNNYKIVDMKETVTFEGTIVPSRSQAAFLVFCTALSLVSVALVLSIAVPAVGDYWYSLVGLSPLVGIYYWQKSQRTEQVQVKMVTSDDEKSTEVVIQGSDEEVDRLRKELQLMEKGMVYVKGIFEM